MEEKDGAEVENEEEDNEEDVEEERNNLMDFILHFSFVADEDDGSEIARLVKKRKMMAMMMRITL